MQPLLILTLYLFAFAFVCLIYWGAGKTGMRETPRVVLAALVMAMLVVFLLDYTEVFVIWR